MFSCGKNEYFQIDKKSNNKNSRGDPIMSPPVKFHSDTTSFSSISINFYQMVFITKPGKAYVRGNNSNSVISGSLPKNTFTEDTEFLLKDEGGHPCKFISVVCGFFYTLYFVSDESGVSNFRLVYCYYKKTPNPLFVNIGNRIPRALFGGDEMSGVIDSEGGIIVITESVFNSPTEKILPTFLPHGDKAVKLAFCYKFVISLGESGRVYMSEISGSSPPKFSKVTELSGKTVVDVAGMRNHCFAVLNDGRVFGYGYNKSCGLGLPEEIDSASRFTVIDSLKKYKIVSAFAGTWSSIFKTSEGKMIVCGWNDNGQLFIPPKETVFPPEEVKNFEGFTFCIAGEGVSSVFVGIDPPPNVANKKISDTVLISEKVTPSFKKIKSDATSGSANKNVKNELSAKDLEISRLKEEISRMKEENLQIKNASTKKLKSKEEEISRLKEENSRLQAENSKLTNKAKSDKEQTRTSKQNDSSLDLLDCKTVDNFKVVKSVGRGGQSEVYLVTREQRLALKVLLISGASDSAAFKKLKGLLQEHEILRKLNHRNIIRTFGFCYGDETHAPSILLEFCPKNLNDSIFDMTSTEKVCCIVEIILGMEAVHASNLIHRDLKPENILLDEEGHVKISDFGISCYVDVVNQSKTAGIGTLKFMAPELLNESTHYNNKVDVYSFGVVLFFVLTGSMPKISLAQQVSGKKADIPKSVNRISRSLINECWAADADDRPSFSEILDTVKRNNFKLIDGVEKEIDEIKSFLSL